MDDTQSKVSLRDGNRQDWMSLRDWFAGKALQGFCATRRYYFIDPSMLAMEAYGIAEAMMRERDNVRT
jgi:hypothetical protein